MNRKLIMLCLLISFTLTSCGSNKLDVDSVLNEESTYKEYKTLISQYKFDDDNQFDYKKNFAEKHEVPEGKVHVSFSENNFVNVTYYHDAECTVPITRNEDCYLSPGESIYASVPMIKKPDVNTYKFESFKIYSIDNDGKRIHEDLSSGINSQGSYNVLSIPEKLSEIKYSELSVVPFGKYENRVLSLKDSFIDSEGKEHNIEENRWIISIGKDDIPTNNDSYPINPTDSYIIKYNYTANKYYFISSSPEAWHYDDNAGYVEFHEQDGANAENNFEIKLGSKFEYKISGINLKNKPQISVDGGAFISLDSASYIGYAKKETVIKIKSSAIIDGLDTVNLKKTGEDGEGKIWVYQVSDISGKYTIDPSKYTFENGTVKLYDAGNKLISNAIELSSGDSIKYVVSPNPGYYFGYSENNEGTLTVGSETDYILSNDFRFEKKTEIELKQPNLGGKIDYYLNDKIVYAEKLSYLKGIDTITAKFTPSAGFKCTVEQGAIVDLTDGIRFVNSSTDEKYYVDEVFVESEEHQPNLTVSLDKSVGGEILFDIFTTNNQEKINTSGNAYVDSGLFSSNLKIIDNLKISTINGIKFEVKNGSLPANEALRFDVNMVDKYKNKTNKIYYLITIPENLVIPIDSDTFYSSVNINVSRVNMQTFDLSEYKPKSGTLISFEYTDENPSDEVKNKSCTENSRKIKMIVKASEGHILTGKGIKNDVYVKETTVSKLKNVYEKMLKDIEVQ